MCEKKNNNKINDCVLLLKTEKKIHTYFNFFVGKNKFSKPQSQSQVVSLKQYILYFQNDVSSILNVYIKLKKY